MQLAEVFLQTKRRRNQICVTMTKGKYFPLQTEQIWLIGNLLNGFWLLPLSLIAFFVYEVVVYRFTCSILHMTSYLFVFIEFSAYQSTFKRFNNVSNLEFFHESYLSLVCAQIKSKTFPPKIAGLRGKLRLEQLSPHMPYSADNTFLEKNINFQHCDPHS